MSQFKVCVYESAVSQLPFRQGLTLRRPVPRHSWGVTQKPALSGFSTLLARTERGGVKRYAGIPFTFTSFSKSMYIVLQVKFKFRPTAPGSSVSFFLIIYKHINIYIFLSPQTNTNYPILKKFLLYNFTLYLPLV